MMRSRAVMWAAVGARPWVVLLSVAAIGASAVGMPGSFASPAGAVAGPSGSEPSGAPPPGSDGVRRFEATVNPASASGNAPAAGSTPQEEGTAYSDEPRSPQTHAVLINGGGAATRNFLSHFHHIQDMLGELRARGIPSDRIHVFSADGEDKGKDLVARGPGPADYWLIERTPQGRALNPPDLTNSVWEGVTLKPAKLRELRRWFSSMSDRLETGDTLLVFVTDHGTRDTDDPDNGLISLWNESMSVFEFRALLGYLKPGVVVVNVMSQCYSGAFADAMTPLNSRVPAGNICGFYSTTADRPAYGCYPEGRDRDRIGHAFRFIDAMGRSATLEEAHRTVLVTDTTPDVPLRTSDLQLERVLADEASRRKIELEVLADQELAQAWKDRARWEPEIRLLDRLGETYGIFSPRSLEELKPRIDSLESVSKELGTYEERWTLVLDDLRKENMERFLEAFPAWKERLDQKKLDVMDPQTKKATLGELLPAVKEFTTGRPDVWSRLQDLRKTGEEAESATYRTDVRLAALMRMRAILLRVAGTEFLGKTAGEGSGSAAKGRVPPTRGNLAIMKNAIESLKACEATAIGLFESGRRGAAESETAEVLPPLEDDLAVVRRALPSWIGIRFRPTTDKQREALGVGRGAAMVEQVYPDGPAKAAGLEPGDVILGPPGAHFSEPNQIREWTMTSPREKPLSLDILREDEPRVIQVSLAPYPARLDEIPASLKAGDDAPPLKALKMVRAGSQPAVDLTSRRHMLFFWATWCAPCKAALPEIVAWGESSGVPVLAVSDENEETIRKFLEGRAGPFPELVASDELRRVHLGYGVSGTPTFVLVDQRGKIEWRQVGYSIRDHLSIPGWSWDGAEKK